MGVDEVQLNFNPTSLMVLNVILGLVMFGIALDLRISDFRNVLRTPKGPLIGALAQFLLLPAITFVLTLIVDPLPSIALGMMLVAACPGGNISNFITHISRGNTALSVSMTALSTAAAIIFTPLNIAFWGSWNPKTAAILTEVQLDPLDILFTVFLLLGVPLVLGMGISHWKPAIAHKLKKPFRIFSMAFFGVFVLGALAANWQHFLNYVGLVAIVVAIHNALAFTIGYTSARISGLSKYDSRAVCIETGIQNSGLGLILIFNFFGGLGGMAIIAAWWGVWHIFAGFTVAWMFSRRSPHPDGH